MYALFPFISESSSQTRPWPWSQPRPWGGASGGWRPLTGPGPGRSSLRTRLTPASAPGGSATRSQLSRTPRRRKPSLFIYTLRPEYKHIMLRQCYWIYDHIETMLLDIRSHEYWAAYPRRFSCHFSEERERELRAQKETRHARSASVLVTGVCESRMRMLDRRQCQCFSHRISSGEAPS